MFGWVISICRAPPEARVWNKNVRVFIVELSDYTCNPRQSPPRRVAVVGLGGGGGGGGGRRRGRKAPAIDFIDATPTLFTQCLLIRGQNSSEKTI